MHGGEEAVQAAKHELSVTERALMENPKSYSTFHHRKWVVSSGCCSLERELALVERLLDVDERNFHGWGYRRAIVSMMGVDVQRELEYSTRKIEDNFSNYSAWHHRSTLLGNAAGDDSVSLFPLTTDVIEEELEFVRQACFIDPSDQSGWFYHRWLIGKLLESGDEEWKLRTVLQELEMCEEVHDLDSEAKWPVLQGLQLKLILKSWHSRGDCDAGYEKWNDVKLEDDVQWLERADPMRKAMYRDIIEGKAAPFSSFIPV